MPASNKSNARGNRGQQGEDGASQQGIRDGSNRNLTRDPRANSHGGVNSDTPHEEQDMGLHSLHLFHAFPTLYYVINVLHFQLGHAGSFFRWAVL